MNVLLLLVPLSLATLGLAVWAFAWAVRRGQFEDLDTPALAILVDDARVGDALVEDAPVAQTSVADAPRDARRIADDRADAKEPRHGA